MGFMITNGDGVVWRCLWIRHARAEMFRGSSGCLYAYEADWDIKKLVLIAELRFVAEPTRSFTVEADHDVAFRCKVEVFHAGSLETSIHVPFTPLSLIYPIYNNESTSSSKSSRCRCPHRSRCQCRSSIQGELPAAPIWRN
jgi:hypothetical protein